MISREIEQGEQDQGSREQKAYTIDVTPVGDTPVSVSWKIWDVSNGDYTDTTSTNMSGSAATTGNLLTSPAVVSLSVGHRYRVAVLYTVGQQVAESFFYITGTR
jgi:hypothetical protein